MRAGPAHAHLRGEEQRVEIEGAGAAARAGEEGEGGEEGQVIIPPNSTIPTPHLFEMFGVQINKFYSGFSMHSQLDTSRYARSILSNSNRRDVLWNVSEPGDPYDIKKYSSQH